MQQLFKTTLNAIKLAMLALLALPASAETLGGTVSITFDDGGWTQYQYGLGIAANYGLPGTIFVPTALISTSTATPGESWVVDWDKIRDFHEAGWEIGAHGRSHLRLTELTPDEIEVEIEGPISDIEREIGVKPVSFSSPFGAFTDETIARIMESYDYHLSWKGHGGRNPANEIDPRYIGRFEVTNDMSAARVCGEMVSAAQNDFWLVLLFHGIVDGDPVDYQITARKYEEIIACASLLDQKGVIQVKTIREAMEAIEAQ